MPRTESTDECVRALIGTPIMKLYLVGECRYDAKSYSL